MLSPKKTKFRKAFKGRIHGNAKGGFALNFGSCGLKALEPERITARQIEAARRAIGAYIMLSLRILFLQDGAPLWQRIQAGIALREEAPNAEHSPSDLFTMLDQRIDRS